MDFCALLNFAKKKNDEVPKEQGRFYSTKYAPPKKESKTNERLSNNVQKFLKKQAEEELEKKRQEREKLNNLLAMRDEKSKNKIRKMLKVTKSANKSVLDDAKDCDNSITAEPEQSEGDDYGYVSKEASELYDKYVDRTKHIKQDNGFAPSRPQSLRDLSGTKERVKAAITREREEAKSHTRQRTVTSQPRRAESLPSRPRAIATSKTLYNPDEERKKLETVEKEQKAKVKRAPVAPPMDFQSLLRLAEKKQHEPVSVVVVEKKKEPERLMSAREKREQEERQRWKEQRAQRDRMRETDVKSAAGPTSAAKDQPAKMETNGRIPKLNKGATPAKVLPTSTVTSSESKPKSSTATSDSLKRSASVAVSASISAGNRTMSTKPAMSSNGMANKRPVVSKSTTAVSANGSSSGSNGTASSNGSSKPVVAPPRNPYAAANKSGAIREFPPRDPAPSKTRAFPPADVQKSSASRKAPPPPSGRHPSKEMSNKRRIYDDDDESEYDSDLADFIDDNDCEEDISSHIRDIFGYDKRRYRDIDEDDDQMESSFAQVQREEFISKKLGLQEDLEDMRMEALHKKQKMAKKRSKH